MTDNMGVFTNVIKWYYFSTFGSMELSFEEWNGQIYTRPNIWSPAIHISYEAINGGSNGMTVSPPSNLENPYFWWDIANNQPITR